MLLTVAIFPNFFLELTYGTHQNMKILSNFSYSTLSGLHKKMVNLSHRRFLNSRI